MMDNVEKQYVIEVHDDAKEMLYSHVRFVANVSVPAARKLRTTLYNAIGSLMTIPHRCPVYQTRRAVGAYRRLIIGRYQIIFSINDIDGIVTIRYILDSRQDNDI